MSWKGVLAALGVLAPAALGAAAQRELGPHRHGHGTLNIAVEGARIAMELEVPGMDIIGFEHAAVSRQDLGAVERGKKQLLGALALFTFPASAGCELTDATVDLESAQDQDNQTSPADAAPYQEHGHAQFHAQYALECATPANLTDIDFGYFRTFAAQELEVTLITPTAQSKYTVERTRPHLDLTGAM